MGVGGGFPGWQFGQVFGLLGLFLLVFPLLNLLSKPKGERLHTKTSNVFLALVVFTVAMATVYVVSSYPYYVARSRLGQSFELVEDVTGLQVTKDTNYPRIVSVLGERAREWPANCIQGRLYGIGNAQFDGPLTVELREAVAVSLENDGFKVRRHVFETGNWSIFAVNGDRSYFYSRYSKGQAGIVSQVDSQCEDTFNDGFEDCRNCVDSFLD